MSVNILNILKHQNFLIDESVLWSILSSGVSFIQNKITKRDFECCLMSLESIHITSDGMLSVKNLDDTNYSRSYVMPEIVDLKGEWNNGNDRFKTEILMYSLGISLRLCNKNGKDQASKVCDLLLHILDRMTNRDSEKRLTLLDVLRICSNKAKEFTKGRSFGYHLSKFYDSYKDTDNVGRVVRSRSHSGGLKTIPSLENTRQLSLGNMNIDATPSNPQYFTNNTSREDSSLENVNSQNSNSNSFSSPSPSFSDHNSVKSQLGTSSYGNLMFNAIDSRQNITEALERVKARRKVIKAHGPMKSSTPVDESQSLNNSLRNFADDINGFQKPGMTNSTGAQEISTIVRLGGCRHILGPEFAIRRHETFSINFSGQKRNSMFSRTSSGRFIRGEVKVNLLNGVVLLIKNLNNKSAVFDVINAIHEAMPDLEFVNYGLCVSLDSEFFFLERDSNIHKLIKKYDQTKDDKNLDTNCGLRLYYRMKYYPTTTIFEEMNSFDQRLLYLQLRQNILNFNEPPISVSGSLSLAGAAVQTEFGDNSENFNEDLNFLKLDYYFHHSVVRCLKVTEDEGQFLRKQQTAWRSLKWSESQFAFIKKVMSHKYFGLHWYKVNKHQLSIIGAIGKESHLLIGRHCIQLVDVSRTDAEVQIHQHFDYKWKQIDTIVLKQKKLTIKPKMQLKVEGLSVSNVFVCHLDSRRKAEYIVRLCNAHHLLAAQDYEELETSSMCNNTGSHLRLSTVDYPRSLRNSVDIEDDDIFIDYASSDEDILQSSGTSKEVDAMPTKYRLDNLKALQSTGPKFSEQEPQIRGIERDVSYHLPKTTLHSDLTRSYDLKYGSELARCAADVKESPLPNGTFEVKLKRLQNETIGIGILELKTEYIQGIFIKCFSSDSAAERCGQIRVGDEIVSINNQPVSHLTQDEVRNVMGYCDQDICLLLRRHNIEDQNESPFNGHTKPLDAKKERAGDTTNIFKTNTVLQTGLSSKNSLQTLRTHYTNIVIPPQTLNHRNRATKLRIEKLAEKEMKGMQQRMKWNLVDTNIGDLRHDDTTDITININDLVSQKLNSKISVRFVMTCARRDGGPNDTFWQQMCAHQSRLIVILGSSSLSKRLSRNREVLDSRCTVLTKDHCGIDDTVTVQRLHLKYTDGPFLWENEGIFQIQFCEWNNKKTSLDTKLQIANLACTLNLNIPNHGQIVLVYEDPYHKPTDFIVIYILILLNLYSELPLDLTFTNQTTVHSIYSQIMQQSKDLIPSQADYDSCISILKLLLPFGDRCASSSDNSDVE